MKSNSQFPDGSAPRPDWSYSVPAPQSYSFLWMLERLAAVAVPIAGLGLLAAANSLGLITVH